MKLLDLFRRRADRYIFRYWDGGRWRAIDPSVAYRRLQEHPEFDPQKHLPLLVSEDTQEQYKAADIVVDAARKAFDIGAFSDSNPAALTELETMAVLEQFYQFVESQQKAKS
jgi:hypothetical protein